MKATLAALGWICVQVEYIQTFDMHGPACILSDCSMCACSRVTMHVKSIG